jgi:hypothetical protein
VNTLYCLEEWRGEKIISPPGDKFTPRGQNSPLGDNFAPGVKVLTLLQYLNDATLYSVLKQYRMPKI